jgi:hypothetical protein
MALSSLIVTLNALRVARWQPRAVGASATSAAAPVRNASRLPPVTRSLPA